MRKSQEANDSVSIDQEQADQVRRTTGATLAARAMEEVLPAIAAGYGPAAHRKAAAKMSENMHKPGFTPGPYHCNAIVHGKIEGDESLPGADKYQICNHNATVAAVYRPKDVPLFKAAPDLYAAVEDLLNQPTWNRTLAPYERDSLDRARAALAAARGEGRGG